MRPCIFEIAHLIVRQLENIMFKIERDTQTKIVVFSFTVKQVIDQLI